MHNQTAAVLVAILVIDADTVVQGGVRYQLVGLDAPEIVGAKCLRERHRGIAAAARLKAVLRERGGELRPTSNRDKYGHSLARLVVGGEDWAAIAIREGHAKSWDGGVRRPDWCTSTRKMRGDG
jgi:endonuclease YncB( thermonuclease family)